MLHTQFIPAKIAPQIAHQNSSVNKDKQADQNQRSGSANGNRTRILALKGLRATRCTIAPLRDLHLSMQSPPNSCQANRTFGSGSVSMSRLVRHCKPHILEVSPVL